MHHKSLIIGHRGAKDHVFENTIASFEKAFVLGADGVELDVHICKTGEIIVFHDLNLKRFFNDDRTIAEVPFSELRELRLDGKHHIPTLSEVLEILPKQSILNIELKGLKSAEPVFNLLKHTADLPETIILSSFYKRELNAYRLLDANAKLGVLSNFNFQEALDFSEKINAYAIHPHYSLVNEDTVKYIRKLGKRLFVWTVNDSEDIKRLKNLNVDGIITDVPKFSY